MMPRGANGAPALNCPWPKAHKPKITPHKHPRPVSYTHLDVYKRQVLFALAEEEGLLLGGSSAVNIVGAMKLAKQLGPGHTIVTILCDSGVRYASKLYNPAFLREKNLPVPGWMERKAQFKADLQG